MTWTAILEKNGLTSSITFSSGYDPKEAYANISLVKQCDGFKVIGLLKGDHTNNFYSVNVDETELAMQLQHRK